jgi:hypothetical protein
MSEQKKIAVPVENSEIIRLMKEYNIKIFAHFIKLYMFHKGLSKSQEYTFAEPFYGINGNHNEILCYCEYCFGLKKSIEFDGLFEAGGDFQIELAKVRATYINDLDQFYIVGPKTIAAQIINSKFSNNN